MALCDYVQCRQYKNGKCMAPGYKECLRAKDDMCKPITTIGEYIGIHNTADDADYTVYVVGKRKAKKAKERWPNMRVMYRNARTKGYWVEYKGE